MAGQLAGGPARATAGAAPAVAAQERSSGGRTPPSCGLLVDEAGFGTA